MADLAVTLQALEERLLQPEVRGNRALLEELLTPEFSEFGSSGRVFGREAIVALLAAEQGSNDMRLEELACDLLAPGVALVTYRIVRGAGPGSLRSSVWVQRDGRWQMRFHQGTRALDAV